MDRQAASSEKDGEIPGEQKAVLMLTNAQSSEPFWWHVFRGVLLPL